MFHQISRHPVKLSITQSNRYFFEWYSHCSHGAWCSDISSLDKMCPFPFHYLMLADSPYFSHLHPCKWLTKGDIFERLVNLGFVAVIFSLKLYSVSKINDLFLLLDKNYTSLENFGLLSSLRISESFMLHISIFYSFTSLYSFL